MRFENAYIPLDGAWCSPFVRWQGPAAELSSLDVAVQVTERALRERENPWAIDELVLGLTVPQRQSFYGAPTLAARLGLDAVSGPLIMQACATSVACVHAAAAGGRRRASRRRDRPDEQRAARRLPARPARPAGRPPVRTGCWTRSAATRTRARGCSRPPSASPHRVSSPRPRSTRSPRGAGASTRTPCATTVPSSGAGWSRSPPGPSASRSRSTPTGASAPLRWRRWKRLPAVEADGVVSYGSQTHPADGCAGLIVTTRADGPAARHPRQRVRSRRAR